MSEPFIGQVIAVGFNFAPVDWHLCDGSLLPIAQYTALFQLVGTTFGGDGQTTFGLPDLRGRSVLGAGQGPGLQPYVLGQISGVESATLTSGQFAGHTHSLAGAATVTTPTPGSSVVLGTVETATPIYGNTGASTPLAGSTVTLSPGGSTPHENRQPTTTLNYIICLNGVFPSQS
jgi:microcystin-dependent protein